jgi:hypothetical protein
VRLWGSKTCRAARHCPLHTASREARPPAYLHVTPAVTPTQHHPLPLWHCGAAPAQRTHVQWVYWILRPDCFPPRALLCAAIAALCNIHEAGSMRGVGRLLRVCTHATHDASLRRPQATLRDKVHEVLQNKCSAISKVSPSPFAALRLHAGSMRDAASKLFRHATPRHLSNFLVIVIVRALGDMHQHV